MQIVKWLATIAGGVFAVAIILLISWNIVDRGPAIASVPDAFKSKGESGLDLSRLLVLVDADMAATAYANGKLFPIEGVSDVVVALGDLNSPAPARITAKASNTVMGWPGSITAHPDGRFAYVVEGRTPPPPGVKQMQDVYAGMPNGALLTTIDISSGAIVDKRPVCRRPNNIDIAPNGDWLLIACGDNDRELAVVPLTDGLPEEARGFDLDLSEISQRGDTDAGLTYAMIHPNGTAAGYIQSNLGVGLVRFALDANGAPATAEAEPPTLKGDWLTVGRWTRSGNHFLVADVKWGPTAFGAVFVDNGAIHSFALSPNKQKRGGVSAATVSKSPEAFEMNRTGDKLIVVNMERTYAPGGAMAVIPRRGGSSLSLVHVDDATGKLTTLGAPVGFRGVLPEDAVFDADGDRVAVVVYQDHDAPRSEGWVEIFAVEDDEIVPTGRRIAMPRGAHDLFALD